MKKPSLEEVQEYMLSRRNGIDPEYFLAFYEANGWVQGKGRKPIKSWKACVITWEKGAQKQQAVPSIMQKLQDRSWANDLTNN